MNSQEIHVTYYKGLKGSPIWASAEMGKCTGTTQLTGHLGTVHAII